MSVRHPDKEPRKRISDFLLAEIQQMEYDLFNMADQLQNCSIGQNYVLGSAYEKKFKEMMRLTDQLLHPIKDRANPYNRLPIK